MSPVIPDNETTAPAQPPMVKVCGLTRPEDAALALACGARFLGFIFHPDSPRCADPATVAAIHAPTGCKVGVFVHHSPAEVLEIMAAAGLDLCQIHGRQEPAHCRELAQEIGPERIIRAFWPERHANADELAAEMDRFAGHVGRFLLDAGTSGGGHGRPFDLDRLTGLAPARPWLVAGGLNPSNARAVWAAVRSLPGCAGLDLSSGLESSPGVKDPAKLALLFRLLHTEPQAHKDDA